ACNRVAASNRAINGTATGTRRSCTRGIPILSGDFARSAAVYGKTPSLNFVNKDRQLALACAGSPQRVFRLTAKGRYRSGQTGQTVNLLALRLRWFESSPAQILRVRHIGSRGSTADCSEST